MKKDVFITLILIILQSISFNLIKASTLLEEQSPKFTLDCEFKEPRGKYILISSTAYSCGKALNYPNSAPNFHGWLGVMKVQNFLDNTYLLDPQESKVSYISTAYEKQEDSHLQLDHYCAFTVNNFDTYAELDLLVPMINSADKTSVQSYLVKSRDGFSIELIKGSCEADLI